VTEDVFSNIHATAVSIGGKGVLLIGASGSGKSDLALRLIDRGAVLVSDDRVLIERLNGQAILHTAPNIADMIEIRGVGIVPMPSVTGIALALVVQLSADVPRFVDALSAYDIVGLSFPCIAVAAFEASAAIKVELAQSRADPQSVIDQAEA
jgi:HPr kinase/phosphorylase